MADVRSMLKASREARRINHPHAAYTKDGKLMCNLCETLVKTESAWQSHLHSTQHTLRLSRAQEAATARDASGASKKRKVSTLDSPVSADRKKAKPTSLPSGDQEDEESAEATVAQEMKGELYQIAGLEVKQPQPPDEVGVSAAELDALDKELADLAASMPNSHAEATISAPAMTAEQVAAQAREEESAQRGRRDVELEAEKEDAARLLDDEFEEMEGLEARVKMLREKREALRKPQTEKSGVVEDQAQDAAAEQVEDDEADDDDDEDFDDWNFGAR